MKWEKTSLRELVLGVLENEYAIKVKSLIFIPVSEESFGYKVKDDGGRKFFVKISLSLTDLHELIGKLLLRLQDLSFIVPQVKTHKGKFSVKMKEGVLVVYPFVEGQKVHENNGNFSKTLLKEVLKMMVLIHSSYEKVKDLPLPKEDFEDNFRKDFEDIEKNFR